MIEIEIEKGGRARMVEEIDVSLCLSGARVRKGSYRVTIERIPTPPHTCPACGGSGGSGPRRCSRCGGTGRPD